MQSWTPFCCVTPYPDKMAKNNGIKPIETTEKRNENVMNLTTLNNGKTVLTPPEINSVDINSHHQIIHNSTDSNLNHINGNHITPTTNGHNEINGKLDQIKNSELSSKDSNLADDSLSAQPIGLQTGSDIASKPKSDVSMSDNTKSVNEDSSDKTNITNDNQVTNAKEEKIVDSKPSDQTKVEDSELSTVKKSQEDDNNTAPPGLILFVSKKLDVIIPGQ